MTPKPGDTIIVTDPSLTGIYGREYTVIEWKLFPSSGARKSESIWVIGTVNGISDERFWLLHGHYEILEEDGVKIEVGNRVIVVNRAWVCDYCKIFIVTEASKQKDWVRAVYEDGSSGRIRPQYDTVRLLKREPKISLSSSLCPDCQGTGEIQLFTSTVECGCTTKKR